MLVVFAAAAAAINAVWTPATEWLARAPQTMREIDPRLTAAARNVRRVDEVAAARRPAHPGRRPWSRGKPAIVTPVAGDSTAIAFTNSFIES